MLASRVTAPAPALGRELLDLVGNTPLVRLDRLAPDLPGSSVLAKAEFLNPGGSVKDRPAASMIRVAECKGALRPGQIIMDATSGNTGIAYAMIGAALGYRVLPKDGHPIVGFDRGAPGIYFASMHSGVTMAPVMGMLAAMEILDDVEVSLLDDYRLARFR